MKTAAILTGILSCLLLFCLLLQSVTAQPLHMSPSFHQIRYNVGPDGRSRMGGHGDELEPFFRGLGPNGGRRRGRGGRWRMWRPMFRG